MISPPRLNKIAASAFSTAPIGDSAANDIDEWLALEPIFRVSPQ